MEQILSSCHNIYIILDNRIYRRLYIHKNYTNLIFVLRIFPALKARSEKELSVELILVFGEFTGRAKF